MVNSEDDNEDLAYPPGFTTTNTQEQPSAYPQRVSVNIRLQYQISTSALTSFQTGSGSNPGDHLANPVVPDLDDIAEIEKVRLELPKQLEDRCRWLEEKFKALESADYHCGINAKDLSLVPDLVLPPKFKTPKFEKYNETSCLEAHITMFCRKMIGYVNNDQLLIQYFKDSLTGAAAKWEKSQKARNYYEFHDEEGHEIQRCSEFRAPVQGLMDNKELEFIEYTEGLEGKDDSKRVPWNYNCNMMIPGEENPMSASEEGQDVGFYMRSGRHYDPKNSKAEPTK
ncbi:uncharacterized protein LOC108484781 [Gossypium arboreum]|uniref:uncharacterized protein LOC108484781 n=1 Tax=Gossypium arboreum TaxID=29729 RepID=UPI00081941B9|nr:uncharacterized protein LOC108484781 [Gossypium arboreum]